MKLPAAGLRGRLVALFLFALLPAMAGSILSAIEQRTRARADAADAALRLASLLAAHFEGMLRSTRHFLSVIDDHPDVLAGGHRCEATLDRFMEATDQYGGLAFVDPAGAVICSSPRALTPVRLDEPTLDRMASGASLVLNEARVGPISGKVVVLSARAVPQAGLIIAGLDLTQLSALAARINLPPGAAFKIVTDEGTMLARYPDTARWIGTAAVKTRIDGAWLGTRDAPELVESNGIDGVRRLLRYAPLTAGGSRFFVVVGLPVATALADVDRATLQNLAGVAIAMVAILFTGIAAGERFLRRPVTKMIETANRIGAGDLNARVSMDTTPGELGALARGIDRMAAELEAHKGRVAALSRRLLEVQESERRTLAGELHDEIGQALTALTFSLHSIRHADGVKRDAAIADAMAITERTLGQVRSLSLDLRPAMLDHLGLPATLRWYAHREAERAGFAVELRVSDPEVRFDARLETTMFRIAQEALTNVARHAGATAVVVILNVCGGIVQLVVRDNGDGFDVAAARERACHGSSLGILGMEERATLAGGTLAILSSSSGTEVTATFTSDTRPATL